MRYKKGSRVEILSQEDVPAGSWQCAEIISGNGHFYTVRYETTGEAVAQRVSNKSIRPSPPEVELRDEWICGAVLEVFHNFSWKMATVSKVLGRNSFVVRLVGSSNEFKVKRSDLRVRQCWQHNQWVVIGKACVSDQDGAEKERLNLKYVQDSGSQCKEAYKQMNLYAKDQYLDAGANIYVHKSCKPSSRSRKRGSWCCQVEPQEGRASKFIAAEKAGTIRRVAVAPFPQKVDAIASTRQTMGEKHIHASSNYRKSRLYELAVEREKPSGAFGCLHAVSVEPNEADNITCSVDSSSVNSNSPHAFPSHTSAFQDNDGCSSDAESFCWLGCDEKLSFPPTRRKLTEEIHSLELHAYRCTIGAFHAAGPLSWEQESLVTDLRISLHISNDEHLIELKNLNSTAATVSCR